jgi:hypothetical protein
MFRVTRELSVWKFRPPPTRHFGMDGIDGAHCILQARVELG